MAVNPSATVPFDLLEDDFDPFGPLDLEVIHPRWTTTPAELARHGVLSYDRTVDTFFVKPRGAYRGGVAVQVGDDRYAIVDQESHVVVAIMVEAFLTRVVKEVPALFDEIERAELRDITLEQIREQRVRVLDGRRDPGPVLAEFYAPDAWSKPLVDHETT